MKKDAEGNDITPDVETFLRKGSRKKIGGRPKDHVQDSDLCLSPEHLFIQKN